MSCSIIIPTYNRKKLISFTLNSLLKITNCDLQIIVVDDGSSDGTVDFLKENFTTVEVHSNTKKGANAARNLGLQKSIYNYILFLDSDDMVDEYVIGSKVEYLNKHKDVDGCYGEYKYFVSDDTYNDCNIVKKNNYPIRENQLSISEHLFNSIGGFYMPMPNVIWRKEFLKKIGGLDETLTVNQDVDLFYKALSFNVNLIGIKNAGYVYIRDHVIDDRVGNIFMSEAKLNQILYIRKKYYKLFSEKGMLNNEIKQRLSYHMFGIWSKSRKLYPETASNFLEFSKEVYWPIRLKGGFLSRILSTVLGPVNVIKLKQLIKSLYKK